MHDDEGGNRTLGNERIEALELSVRLREDADSCSHVWK
jgi:hypothetical protein